MPCFLTGSLLADYEEVVPLAERYLASAQRICRFPFSSTSVRKVRCNKKRCIEN